jgi:hypothetical protein
MAITRIFAFNSGSTISGTTQIGDIAVSDIMTKEMLDSGLRWFAGPDESDKYIICTPATDQPTPDGGTAKIGFFGTKDVSDSKYVTLINRISKQNFQSSLSAKTWAQNNNYWSSHWTSQMITSGLTLYYDVVDIDSFRGEPTINTINYNSTGAGRYNNPSFSGSLVNTNTYYKGSPIWKATFIPQDSTYISRLGSTEGFGFYHAMGIRLKPNNYYIASVYFKSDYPKLNNSNQGFINTYSNISGWGYNSTAYSRYQCGEWTRLYCAWYYSNNGYCYRPSSAASTYTVNTTGTTTIVVSKSIILNQLSDYLYLYAVVHHSPTIASNGGLTGLSILNHGLETTNWTKLSYPSNIKLSSELPYTYYMELSVPSTNGVDTNISLRFYPYAYYTEVTDSKYWKVTFDVTNLQVDDVIETYWAAPMIEEKSISFFPSHFLIGTRGSTSETGGGLLDLSGNDNNGELISGVTYDNSNLGCLYFNGANKIVKTVVTTFGNNTTWSAWIKCDSINNTYNMFMGRFLPYFSFHTGRTIYFSNNIGGQQRTVSTSATLSLNTWYYTSFTTSFDGSDTTCKIYINGVESASNTFSGSQSSAGSYFCIGDGDDQEWYRFNGYVALVKIFNRTLPVDEILENFNYTKYRFM